MASPTVSVNGRAYHLPDRPVVVVCIDGCEPLYLELALAAGVMPALARIREQGFYRLARCVIPSFTNPNNLSIVTGCRPRFTAFAATASSMARPDWKS